nr:MAG TPA: hypothetical protein [Caudoviricetes sp.]
MWQPSLVSTFFISINIISHLSEKSIYILSRNHEYPCLTEHSWHFIKNNLHFLS